MFWSIQPRNCSPPGSGALRTLDPEPKWRFPDEQGWTELSLVLLLSEMSPRRNEERKVWNRSNVSLRTDPFVGKTPIRSRDPTVPAPGRTVTSPVHAPGRTVTSPAGSSTPTLGGTRSGLVSGPAGTEQTVETVSTVEVETMRSRGRSH